MAIFNLKQGKLLPINEVSFVLEKDIQKIVQDNIYSLFGLEFVASEFFFRWIKSRYSRF